MRNLVNVPENVALVTTKVTKDRWDIGCTSNVTAHKAVSAYDTSSVFPLLREPLSTEQFARPNLSPSFTNRIADLTGLYFGDTSRIDPKGSSAVATATAQRGDLIKTFGPRDVFDWIFAVLHSPLYRERYADLLKSDFARVPLPRDRAVFSKLVPLGAELASLHLLDPLAAPILTDPKVRFVNPNGVEARLDGIKPDARRNAAGRVYVNNACWFETVPLSVWDHWIGGYQPAQKWLKDRSTKGGKNKSEGRILTLEDQLHYRRMITALGRTAELMVEIDDVIAKHGGWPDAFKGMTD